MTMTRTQQLAKSTMLEATDFQRSVAQAALAFIKAFPSLKREMVAATRGSASKDDHWEFAAMWYSTTATSWGSPQARAVMKNKGLSDTMIGALTTRIKESKMTRANELIERVMQGEDPAKLLSEATGYVKASELLASIEKQLDSHLKQSITKRQGNTGPARETARLIGKYRMLTGKFLVDVIKLFGDVPEYEITVEVATEEEKEFNEKGLTKQNMQSVAKKVAAFINSNISA